MPISATGISNKQRGFTLIELVVVITLLAIFSGLSLPLLMNAGDGGERRVMRRLAGTVKQLYNEAALTREEHLLTFDIDDNSISAFRLAAVDNRVEKEPFGKPQVSLEPLRLRQVEVVGQGSFRSGQVSIHIYPLGWMEDTRLALQMPDGQERVLSFSPLTGATKIDETP